MSDLPAPLTPPDCDLFGLHYMPLDVSRLIDSDLFAWSSGDEFKLAVRLWCKAWHQVPAGSLPDDDRSLAHLAGRDIKSWKKAREMALHGFIKCSDGRLYHPVIAKYAIEAFEAKKEHQEGKENDKLRKKQERMERKAIFQELKKRGHTMAWDTPTSQLRAFLSRLRSDENPPPVTRTGADESHGNQQDCPPPVTANKGNGNGKGEVNIFQDNHPTGVEDLSPNGVRDENPPPPASRASDPSQTFAMSASWKPSPEISDMILIGGMSSPSQEEFDDALNDFRAHWASVPKACRTQAEWDKALVKSLKHDRAYAAASQPKNQPPAARPINESRHNTIRDLNHSAEGYDEDPETGAYKLGSKRAKRHV